ncbi:MAG: arginyltransferase [Planctomycetaceae bacterium]|nr:arginyltransferase [Planctomycetaceae bacterium]
MISLIVYTPPPSPCSYLPQEQSQLTYEVVAQLTPEEYLFRLQNGWRRFGHALFKPECGTCQACQSLRVPVATFKPDRSQRRAAAANDGEVTLVIGAPRVTRAKLDLYDRFHAAQHLTVGWQQHAPESPTAYADTFVDNPIPTEEWCYFLNDKLVGVGYVDVLPEGFSAIYYFHDPEERDCSLGTYNVLCILREAGRRQLPYVYLGYYVAGCRSLEYKARFRPNEVLHPDGEWRAFLQS